MKLNGLRALDKDRVANADSAPDGVDPFLASFTFAEAGAMRFAFDGDTLYIRFCFGNGITTGTKSWDAHLAERNRRYKDKRAAGRSTEVAS